MEPLEHLSMTFHAILKRMFDFRFHSSLLFSNYTYLPFFADSSSSESAPATCGNSALTISGVRIMLNPAPSVSLKISKMMNNLPLSFWKYFFSQQEQKYVLCKRDFVLLPLRISWDRFSHIHTSGLDIVNHTIHGTEEKLTGQLCSPCLSQVSHTALVVHLLEAYLNCKDPCDGNGTSLIY